MTPEKHNLSFWQKLFTRTGILESIDLTFGGAGNQVMTIDGVGYATWIDYKEWPPIGSKVRHKPYKTHPVAEAICYWLLKSLR